MRRISRSRLFNVWAVCSVLWAVVWLFYFSVRYGREAAVERNLAVAALALAFGLPVITLLVLVIFFQVRHWIAHRPKRRRH
jgi:hypothetical protein